MHLSIQRLYIRTKTACCSILVVKIAHNWEGRRRSRKVIPQTETKNKDTKEIIPRWISTKLFSLIQKNVTNIVMRSLSFVNTSSVILLTILKLLPLCAVQKWASRKKKLPFLCPFPFAQSKNGPTEKKLPFLCSFPFAQSRNEPAGKKNSWEKEEAKYSFIICHRVKTAG